MNDLFQNHAAKTGPVECLGQTFPSDEARHEHYLELLAEKLKDPDFRKIEGFPIGSDEDILALSNPPYYTACPNPFIEDFVRHYGTAYNSSVPYSKEPFVADVSEGKNDPIYNAHSYHTKVPHKAIMRYILHYTQPGDLIVDSFCGTGMAGVAAQLCGDRNVVESLGYMVDPSGIVFERDESSDKPSWTPISKLGRRYAILNDLSPLASSVANSFNAPLDIQKFNEIASNIGRDLQSSHGWIYQTLHNPAENQIADAISALEGSGLASTSFGLPLAKINYTVWSEVFVCSHCAGEIIFWDAAIDHKNGGVKDDFSCPHCDTQLSKRGLERAWESRFDELLNEAVKQPKNVPVLINYSFGKSRVDKRPDAFDFAVLKKISETAITDWAPNHPMLFKGESWGDTWRAGVHSGITHVQHFYTRRNLLALSALRKKCDGEFKTSLLFAFTSTHQFVNRLCRLNISNYFSGKGGKVDKPLDGTLYAPSISLELNVIEKWSLRSDLEKVYFGRSQEYGMTSTGSAAALAIPDNSLDYVFIDPPFGGNLMYSELNFLWESWLKVFTNQNPEAIQCSSQSKSINDYRAIMTECFKEAFRTLKPGRWMTVEFSNTQAAVWNAIQIALQEAGFVVANVSAIDKKKGSFKAVTTTTAVKQDLVISAYKPNGGLEDRFSKNGACVDSVWDFVRAHLQYLPTVKVKAGELEFITERDPRIIFDRMVAWFVRHNTPVPMSTQEFQAGLVQLFVERDGMIFLPDQVAEYDKKRMQVSIAPQMEMFVSDERSAIDWLSDFLKRRPSTYQETSPEFMGQLGAGWKKHEAKPELLALLEGNFLKYDGTGDVPSQIHSYLSTNHKGLRGLDKNNPALVAKARDRWYVPDPNKAQDLEKKREKALLKEFETYRAFTGRKIKESRLEVLRAGFRAAWATKDYQTIINIANKLPEETLQEDEKLLTLYDMALTRTEDGI
ncbi:DNA methyltransferase [Dyella sp.]|uniref:DNA methyltransferase n=1 Tax=Dyella sp. TaxID=1869338 RepID=UPI002B482178|nr:DNA methyltransferase [Dyella sp.]HKT30376.1 DNA methyltransferase [Dyella sp.]